MDASQSEGIGVLIASVGLDTRLPVVLHRLAVGDVVEVAERSRMFLFNSLDLRSKLFTLDRVQASLPLCSLIHSFPFTFVVPQHLLAV